MTSLLAIVFFSVIASVAWWMIDVYLRNRYTAFQTLLFCINVLLCRLLWRVKICGEFPLSADQGAVLICNHRSSVDPFFIQLVARRPVHWMVAKEFYDHLAFGWFLRSTEAIPTRRGGVDTAATKLAIRLASSGELVGMFPEGRINQTDDLFLPIRPGAAMVAIKARVPALPCYIEGAPYGGTAWSPLFMRAKVTLHFGKPIDLSPYYDRPRAPGHLAEVTQQLMQEVARLAGREDVEIKRAGRRWLSENEVEEIEKSGVEGNGSTAGS